MAQSGKIVESEIVYIIKKSVWVQKKGNTEEDNKNANTSIATTCKEEKISSIIVQSTTPPSYRVNLVR